MKYLILLFTTTLLSSATHAQPVVGKILPKFTAGIKAGANFQQVSGSKNYDSKFSTGYLGGVFVGITKKKVGVQVEGLIKSARIDMKPDPAIPTMPPGINTVYVDVPVVFQYRVINRVWLQAGPQFSSLISAKRNNNDVKNNFYTSEFSGVIGFQAILPFHLTAGVRYVMGFTDVNKGFNKIYIWTPPPPEIWKNRSIQVSVGFRFL